MPAPTTGSSVTPTELSGQTVVDSLLSGYHWTNSSISYSFIVPGTSVFPVDYPDPTYFTRMGAFSVAQQSAAAEALTAWSNVANVSFAQTIETSTSAGTIRFGFSYSEVWGDAVGSTYLPNSRPSGGDVWLDPNGDDFLNGSLTGLFSSSAFADGSYAYFALEHELGHALGLKHPFDDSGNGGGGSIAGTSLSGWDSQLYTIMSYTPLASNSSVTGFSFYPTTPMMLDIDAIQSIYGANLSFNAGDTVYSFNDNAGQRYFQTIWDAGGTNTIAYSGTHSVTVDLREEHGSTIGNPVYAQTQTNPTAFQVKNVWIDGGTIIQIADLSRCNAAYTVTGNDYGDTIYCGAGTGVVSGGKGADTIFIGTGTETIDGGAGSDTIVFSHTRSAYAVTYSGGTFVISGTDGSDTIKNAEIFKFAGDMTVSAAQLVPGNVVNLTAANSSFRTTSANDVITGLSGLNSVIYSGKAAEYIVTASSGAIQVQDTVAGRDGTDLLQNIERLKFADKSIAFDVFPSFSLDVAGTAGEVVKIMGVVFGPGSVQAHPDYVGIGLGLADGGMSYANLMQLALGVKLGTGFTNDQEIQLLYTNLLGHSASATDVSSWSAALTAGQYTPSSLAQLAAESSANAVNVHLAGLAETGVLFS
jgi:hypothetical protein